MDEEKNARLHDQALGQALYASTLAEITFHILAATLPPGRVRGIIDGALLSFEKNQALVEGGPGAIVHVRQQLEALLKLYPETPE